MNLNGAIISILGGCGARLATGLFRHENAGERIKR